MAHFNVMINETQKCETVYYIGGQEEYPFVEILYNPRNSERPIVIQSGCPYNFAGTELSACQALSPKWRKDFQDTGSEWFIKYLKRLAEGGHVSIRRIKIAHFLKRKKLLRTVKEVRQIQEKKSQR